MYKLVFNRFYNGVLLCIVLVCLPSFSIASSASDDTNPTKVHKKEIAFSFDDSPRFARGFMDGPTRAKRLIAELEDHDIGRVVFFSNTFELDDPNGEGMKRLQSYSDAGHIIANHTHSHANFNETSAQDFIKEIDKADQILRQFDTFKPWFRFPYLREGNTLQKRDAVRKHLASLGYINGYTTIDTYDWYMESLFQQAIKENPQLDLERVKRFYVETIVDGAEQDYKAALKVLNRSPKHLLLMHETDLAALFTGDLADALRAKGWTIISNEEAYTDDISNYKTPAYYDFNPGRVDEIALDRGINIWPARTSLTQEGLNTIFYEMVLED
ncbi:polysaccharide deacetylase family protein [Ningiella sp. W23]|uniref:polysaccharide deacetylase family protein n=1 Tax=Ningiella sp. W23 TaxID=3023715 RepID=UPI00375844FB